MATLPSLPLLPMPAVITAAYAAGVDALGPELFFVAVMFAADSVPYFLLNGLFLRIERAGYLQRYRILPKPSDRALTTKAITEAVVGHLCSPLFLWGLYHLEGWWNPDQVTRPLPDLWTLAAQLLGCMVVEDALFYWTHRALHLPFIYKRVHKVHHEFHVSNGFAAQYAHPLEVLFGHIVPSLLGPYLFRAHLFTRAVYTFILVLDSFVGHCGYHLPFVPFTSALRHSYHHSHNVGTFGLKTGFWDWLCGTDAAFHRWLTRRAKSAATVCDDMTTG